MTIHLRVGVGLKGVWELKLTGTNCPHQQSL